MRDSAGPRGEDRDSPINGRVYNRVVGRFISADPVNDCGLGTHAWNCYAYVRNRALSLEDVTGFRGGKTLLPNGPAGAPTPSIGLGPGQYSCCSSKDFEEVTEQAPEPEAPIQPEPTSGGDIPIPRIPAVAWWW